MIKFESKTWGRKPYYGETYYIVAFPKGERLVYCRFSGGGGGSYCGGKAPIQHRLCIKQKPYDICECWKKSLNNMVHIFQSCAKITFLGVSYVQKDCCNFEISLDQFFICQNCLLSWLVITKSFWYFLRFVYK